MSGLGCFSVTKNEMHLVKWGGLRWRGGIEGLFLLLTNGSVFSTAWSVVRWVVVRMREQ